ncbi:MAG TPA: NUDIX hydrolase [Lacipirellulaceae bacterium]|jgi:ADP-ribose pyrophosphatase|nr:NUDIX hydrolase [Lacipirellulaceae bacterium]
MSANERTLLENRRFAVVERTVTRPDGQAASVQFVRHPGSVAILPILDDGRICLIRNRRLTVDKTLIEIPAGTREPDEEPLKTAHRELAEETGYRARRMEEMVSYYPSPGISSERMHLYVARELTAGDTAREANEEIENYLVTWDDAMALVERGEIVDGKTILALLLYKQGESA